MPNLQIPQRNKMLAEYIIPCATQPLKRPRTRFKVQGVYQPLDNQKELRSFIKTYESLGINEPVIVDTFISLLPAKTTKFSHPVGKTSHGDDDNLRKAISDALVFATILEDDCLILGGSNFKFFGPENLTVVQIWSITKTKDVQKYGI